MLGRDDRAHHRGRVVAGADDDVGDPGSDGIDERVARVADGHDHRDGHAPLARRSVAGRDRRVGGRVDVRVGQHDHVVLGAAERLDALAVARPRLVDVAGYRRAPHERHRVDVGVGQQGIDRLAVALDDGEDAVGEAGLLHEIGQQQRRRRILLGRLQHERVAAGDGVGHHPERHHHREVERRDAGHDPDRLGHREHVDAGRGLGRVRSLQQVRDAAGELDVLEAAGHLTLGVGQHLAVLAGDDRGQVVAVGVEQLAQAEERGGASAERRRAPRRRGLDRDLHGVVDLGGRRQRHLGRLHAARRVEDGARASRGAGFDPTVDPVPDGVHGVPFGAQSR